MFAVGIAFEWGTEKARPLATTCTAPLRKCRGVCFVVGIFHHFCSLVVASETNTRTGEGKLRGGKTSPGISEAFASPDAYGSNTHPLNGPNSTRQDETAENAITQVRKRWPVILRNIFPRCAAPYISHDILASIYSFLLARLSR